MKEEELLACGHCMKIHHSPQYLTKELSIPETSEETERCAEPNSEEDSQSDAAATAEIVNMMIR